jgi:hypothetical protein
MKREPVESSHIKSVGYNKAKSTLEVEFKTSKGKTNAIWEYAPVTPDQHLEMVEAESVGKYFNANIKDNPAITATKVS